MPLFNFKKGIFKIVIFITTAAEASQNAVARVDRWLKPMVETNIKIKCFQEFAPISLK